jgi:hypothetical protein
MRQEIVRTIAVAALTGGLAGSIFTWFVNRQHHTVVTYRAVLWNLVDDKTTALVRDLKIGNDNVKVINTRLFDFVVQSGPKADSASLVINFQPSLQIFGMKVVSPSSVRPEWIKCKQALSDSSAVVCDLQNLAPGDLNHYQLWIVTNQPHVGKIQSLNPVVEILPYDKYVDRKIFTFVLVTLGVFFASFSLVGRLRSWLEIRRLTRSLERESFKPSEREYPKIFDSDEERDALNRAFRDETVHNQR